MIDRTEAPIELEFRDGKRWVQYYLARYMTNWETYLMTYDEAVARVNQTMESEHVSNAMLGMLRSHFREH